MNWAGSKHPLESVIEWVAPMPLAGAVGWACLRLGLTAPEALAFAAGALVAGIIAVKAAGPAAPIEAYSFEPATVEGSGIEPDELLLEARDEVLLLEAKDEVLLLDDPLVEPDGNSRVVRLFARQQPTPGELVERIEEFLGDVDRVGPPQPPEERPDASAALFAALANVRASLR